jgi:predicted nucleic acid-binding protein
VIVLDTNVVAELMRPRPARAVVRWVGAQASTSLFVTTITEAEIYYGLALLPVGKRRRALESAVGAIFAEVFDGRILAFGSEAARAYAHIAAKRRRLGRPIAGFDAQIAAIAATTGALLATRNGADFADCGLGLIDPWTA